MLEQIERDTPFTPSLSVLKLELGFVVFSLFHNGVDAAADAAVNPYLYFIIVLDVNRWLTREANTSGCACHQDGTRQEGRATR
jgi:hypothetical protein